MEDLYQLGYFRDDTVFNIVNKHFISLQDADIRSNNECLQMILGVLIEKMKNADILFNIAHQRIMFGGSYYKGTKVSVPDEFDLDIIINFDIKYNLSKFQSSLPGFTKIYIGDECNFRKRNEKAEKIFRRLLSTDMYLDQDKFRRWVEGIMSKVLNELPKEGNKCVLNTNGYQRFYIVVRKCGPAFTLDISTISNKRIMSVDLVPVLEFNEPLPKQSAKLKQFNKKNWYAVPKLYHNDVKDLHLYWRLCFYEQEKEMFRNNGELKPIIRQIKKLRDNQDWKKCIASYYIETVFLHKIGREHEFDKLSKTQILLKMLIALRESFKNREIPYYWDTDLNLLSKINTINMRNLENRLSNIILQIKKSITSNPLIIASFILNEHEMIKLQNLQVSITRPPILYNTPAYTEEINELNEDLSWVKIDDVPTTTTTNTGENRCLIL